MDPLVDAVIAVTPPQTRKRSVWPIFVTFPVAFVVILLANLALVIAWMLVLALRGGHADISELASVAATTLTTSPIGLSCAAAINAVVLLVIAVLVAAIETKVARDRGASTTLGARLRVGRSAVAHANIALAVLGFLGLSLLLGSLAGFLGLEGGVMTQMARALAHPDPLELGATLLGIAVCPGLGEELFFRGFMQTALIERWGRVAGILISAAFFGALHLDPLQSSLAFLSGIYLGAIAHHFQSLRPAIVAHVVNNAVFVLFAAYLPDASNAFNIAALAFGAIAFPAAVVVLVCSSRARAALAANPIEGSAPTA